MSNPKQDNLIKLICGEVEKALAELKTAHPDLELTQAFDFVTPVQEEFDASMTMLYEGALLAVIVVWFFLRDWRATLIPMIAVPISLIGTFAGLLLGLGIALNIDVLVPALPDGWRATSARFSAGPTQDTGQWYNGYVSPEGEFAAVVQQDYDAAEFVKTQTKDGSAQGIVEVAGQPWTTYLSADGADRSLVREGGDATIVVTGTLPQAQLEQFAAALRSAATS